MNNVFKYRWELVLAGAMPNEPVMYAVVPHMAVMSQVA